MGRSLGELYLLANPKKGDIPQYSSNIAIALISHSSEVLLKIEKKNKPEEEISEEQYGFPHGKGTRN